MRRLFRAHLKANQSFVISFGALCIVSGIVVLMQNKNNKQNEVLTSKEFAFSKVFQPKLNSSLSSDYADYDFPYCECHRRGRTLAQWEEDRIPSSCGDYTTSRGRMQKVVAYSYFGDSQHPVIGPRYFSQIRRRAEEVRDLYGPDWTMRVYHDKTRGSDDFEGLRDMCGIFCDMSHVDFCDVTALPRPFGDLKGEVPVARVWRFITMLDPLVDVFVSRNLDAPILQREVDAVKEWIELGDRMVHIMRDHPTHDAAIKSGLWGARNRLNRTLLGSAGEKIMAEKPGAFDGYDESVLLKHVWPLARESSVQHDSYHCDREEGKLGPVSHPARPFPTQRQGNEYVGHRHHEESSSELPDCPKQCRPKDHQEWNKC